MSMKHHLTIILILSFWPSRNDCQEIYTGFGFGFGPSFPVINQTKDPCGPLDILDNCHTSLNLVKNQKGPVVNSEFFVGYEPFELTLHSSFFRLSQREVQNTQEYRIFDSGGWLNSFLIELRYKVSAKRFRPYLNVGLGAFHFRPEDDQYAFPKLHFGGVFGLGSEFAYKKREVYFYSEIRFQYLRFRGIREDFSKNITGTLDFIAGCRFWIASQ